MTADEEVRFAQTIDTILEDADLTTISAKQIRKSLQEKVDIDLSEKKVGERAISCAPLVC